MSGSGQTRSFSDVGLDVRVGRKRTRPPLWKATCAGSGGSIVRRPGLLDDARAVAQRDLGAGPAFDRSLERRLGQQEVVHAGKMLVEVRAGGIVPTVD